MDIGTFIDNVVGQFDDTPEGITADTPLRAIEGWCSLVALSIIAMIDEEYGVSLKGEDLKKAITIQDLFDTVSSKKNG